MISGENQPKPRSSCVCGAPALSSLLFTVIAGDWFRFGFDLTLNQCPALVTATSLSVTCGPCILQMPLSGVCIKAIASKKRFFWCLVTDLWILCRFLPAAPESSLLAALPHAGSRGWVWGWMLSAEQCSASCLCSGFTSSTICAVPWLGLCEDLETALHCLGSSAVRQRDDKQPDGSYSVPAQEYLHCKHAGRAVTRARFACLICCSWERWICFSAVEGERDDSVCLLRLCLIVSESFCSAASLNG